VGGLTEEEFEYINREGERIKYSLSRLINSFPNHAKSITGMSNWLIANKSTCQRMVETINKATNGLQVIEFLPGPKGLSDFIKLADKKNIHKSIIKISNESVLRFKNLIHEFSRSHSSLKKLILSSKKTESGYTDKLNSRRALYEAASVISGESIDTVFTTFILKENPDNPKYLQQFTLNYYEGVNFSEGARPMAVLVAPCEQQLNIQGIDVISNSKKIEGQLNEVSLIENLTSKQILEDADISIEEEWVVIPLDSHKKNNLEIGIIKNYQQEQLSPFYGGVKASSMSNYIRSPTKQLNLICFLERKFVMRSAANVGIYSSISRMVKAISSPDSLWFDRYHDDVDLSLLSSSSNFSEKFNYPKADYLIDQIFELSGCNKDEYCCYLIKVEYPIWSKSYRLYFQYDID
jgi:hypothetical protein